MAKKIMALLVTMVMMIILLCGVVFAYDYNDPIPEAEAVVPDAAVAFRNALAAGGNATLTESVTVLNAHAETDLNVVTKDASINFGDNTFTLDVSGVYDNPNWKGLDIRSGKVTINGNNGGIVNKNTIEEDVLIDNLYAIYVGSDSSSADVTITGGRYIGGISAIQVTQGTVTIKGGYFETLDDDKRYVINCKDKYYNAGSANFVVEGGTFVEFNPANNASEGEGTNYVASGYKVVESTDSKGRNIYKVVVDEEYNLRKVLKEGGTYTFNSNIDAVDTFTVPAGVTATIDLNGYKLSHTYAATKARALITNNGTLTIKDSKGSGVITFTDSGKGGEYASNTIQNNGTLTIDGGSILNESSQATANRGYCHAIDTNKKLVINGGTIKSNEYSAIRVWCTTDNDTSVEVNGGTIVNPIDMHNVDGKANKGTLVINGGTFTTSGTNGQYTQYNVRLVNFGADYDEITMTINDGNFNGGIAAVVQSVDLKPILSISGGTFNFDVTPYLTENKKWDSATGVVGCAHTSLTGYPLKEATLEEEGCQPYYECNDCHKLFLDASATVEVNKSDLVIPKLIEIKGTEAIVSDAAVMGAVQDAADSAVVELSVLVADETVKEVTVPVTAIRLVVEENKGLLIEKSDVTVTLDAKTVATVAEEAKDAEKVTIEVTKEETKILNTAQKEAVKDKKVEVVISAKILADGKEISDFKGGKVTVEIPFKPDEGLKVSDYKFVYIDDNGKVTEIPSKYFDGVMVVELEHFSEYAIVREIESESTVEESVAESNSTTTEAVKDDTPKTGAISVIGLVSVMAVGGLVLTRKKK